jgi:hypothetical protein
MQNYSSTYLPVGMLVLFYSEISDNTSYNSNNFFAFSANFQELQ